MAFVLTLAAGALLALSLPPFNIEWLGWFALAPLLVAAHERRPLEAMGLGLLAGLVCGFIHVGWYPNAHALQFAYVPFLCLAMLMGAAAVAAAAARRRWDGRRWVLFVASAGVAAEWLTTFSPLPLNMALCQYQARPVIQIASFTGIWGVSFLLWWTYAALADVAPRWGEPGQAQGPGWAKGPPLRAPLAAAGAAIALSVGYGYLVLARVPDGAAGLLRAAAIQDHSVGETADYAPATAPEADEVNRQELTRRAAAKQAKLIVWSEGRLGATFTPDPRDNPTAELARELNTHLVVGYTEPAQPNPFNCAAIVAPDGSVKGIHRKIHLFLGERQGTQVGREAAAFDTALGRIGVEICFDSCYTDVTRCMARSGAQLIAMPNYDPPTVRGVLHRLHSAVLPFRAVENRVPFVRADANGCSQIVDATGRIIAQSPMFASDALVGDVTLGDGKGTLFTRLGDWVAYLCVLIVAVGSVSLVRSRPGRRLTRLDAPTSQVAVMTTSSAAGASE